MDAVKKPANPESSSGVMPRECPLKAKLVDEISKKLDESKPQPNGVKKKCPRT